jgi:hypothetical protein
MLPIEDIVGLEPPQPKTKTTGTSAAIQIRIAKE